MGGGGGGPLLLLDLCLSYNMELNMLVYLYAYTDCFLQDIADLFLNTWVGNKPLVVPSRGLQIIDTGCRFVSQQPLVFNESRYNKRRLDELWYQLLHAGKTKLAWRIKIFLILLFKSNTT